MPLQGRYEQADNDLAFSWHLRKRNAAVYFRARRCRDP